MSICGRIERLERAVGAEEPEHVFYLTLYGRRAPERCCAALLARDRRADPDRALRLIRVFDAGLCLACGGEHLVEA